MLVIVVLVMFRMIMIGKPARHMFMVLPIPGVAVHQAVGVFVFVFMKMTVGRLAVPMKMSMQMLMHMVVFMFMLQFVYGAGAVLPIGIGQTVKVAQPFVPKKRKAGKIFQYAALVHDKRTVGQLGHKKHIVADQQQGYIKIPQDIQQQFLSLGI